ncbi:MAG: cytochrome P450 [Myxococcota bacterium]|nr:cytochrome P450 [Myxococcota bacterium]
MTKPVPTGLELTALDARFREDPYPVLAELREREPVHRDLVLKRVVFTRHDDVLAILRHPDLWSDPRKGTPGSFAREFLARGDEEPSMLLMDDPGHRRLRELVRHPFTPRAVERWRGRAREVAERVIGSLEDGEFDVIERVAKPIPTVVIAELLGIDPGRHERFKAWSDATIVVAFSPANDPEDLKRAEEAYAALDAFFRGEIEQRRGRPGDDLISAMLRAEEAGDRLSDDEIVSQCELLLLAGNLTTTDLIGNGVMALLRHPGELAKLRARPELMKNAVEEMLRYDSPVTNSGRIAHEDMEIAGEKVCQGESLSVSLAAANRDPAIYPEPDRFDIEREDVHHQAFGGGRHFCLGAHLARLEAQETLAVLLARFPRLELGPGGHAYAANPSFRGLTRFSVEGGRGTMQRPRPGAGGAP